MGIRSYILFFSIDMFVKFFGLRPMSTVMYLLPPWILPILLKRFGAEIGEEVKFRQGVRFVNISSEGFVNLKIGSNCYIGYESMIDLTGQVTIEEDVTLAPRCTVLSHQDVGNRPLSKVFPAKNGHTRLKRGCWIGASATILGGVEVGENSAVAAGSVVIKDVQDNTAVGGVPARIIREHLL